ncbi:putative mitochondrial hypothetical protein [Leptomonas pyrrhocoris]|uniref:Uncharacterized protein n=1 Tax=Leptomonas pyrrhocoris TaxID=157538 RepID=A0A0M9FZD1_LEPPY|nr:putative mitochondrial hypothetical protein [Leptomonas pyrrhocoris]XP_015657468.1 putative mitochondrial hypothetical protein [Leptomonas pyrrhocoris]KPA79028.1 putative mitochondrial hypothetical protein [Leptomonas pyrrhocoris]KPA79029.1 putative mitochondrial hypothetical protein [Leptomonas pyrrhocoris]|eukprot:XP_015657467.1 putative mitochondrial hypothetical protein [Leptomonas pyrrhocoris]
MKPYIWPSDDEAPPVSARRTFPRQSRANRGTLNLFAPDPADPAELPAGSAHQRGAPSPITGQRSLHYGNHNRESTATREFPTNGLRRVPLPSRCETPHGIRHVRDAAGAGQSVQVVNITAAYRDPAQMAPLKTGVRCVPLKAASDEVGAALAYAGTRQQLSARVLNAPVGKVAQPSPFTVDYSPQAKFAQAVRDHAQQRARGVAEFYVQLTRNAVGGVTSSTPKPTVVPWTLDGTPPRRVLTLGRCCDQLVALTSMPIALRDLAGLLWGSNADRENSDAEEGAAAPLEDKEVSFRDFAATFAQNSSDGRLAQMKI